MLENTIFDKECFLFTIDFKSLCTNISVKDVIEVMKSLFLKYQDMIRNAHFIIELMELVLNCVITTFQKEFFCTNFGKCYGHKLSTHFVKRKHYMAKNVQMFYK